MKPTAIEARSSTKQANSTERLSDYDKAIALNPTYFQAYYNRGIAYVKTKQFEKAIEDFTQDD